MEPTYDLWHLAFANLVEHREKFAEEMPVRVRLHGLSAEQLVLALPDDALRALSPAYLATLSQETQEAIRKRVGSS